MDIESPLSTIAQSECENSHNMAENMGPLGERGNMRTTAKDIVKIVASIVVRNGAKISDILKLASLVSDLASFWPGLFRQNHRLSCRMFEN